MKYAVVLNCGSSSLKFAVFSWPMKSEIGRGHFERIGEHQSRLKFRLFNQSGEETFAGLHSHSLAAKILGEWLALHNFTAQKVTIFLHRIVAAGEQPRPKPITASVERLMERYRDIAPLHNPAALAVIRYFRRKSRGSRHIGCFDSSFFSRLPNVARAVPLDRRVATQFGLRRFGFHGFSHQRAAEIAYAQLKKPARRVNVITVHLGSGCSMAAVAHGLPLDTSMGFTPLEGLVMSHRAGDLDPGLLLHLLRNGYSPLRLIELLEHRSGLAGLTGLDDMREILLAAGFPVPGFRPRRGISGRKRAVARAAIDIFVYRLRKYLGAYSAVLGRVDAVVFTGAIGEQSAVVRRMILRRLPIPGDPRMIVVPTDEERAMLQSIRR